MTTQTTNTDGKTTFTNIVAGDYDLTITKTDYNTYTDTITVVDSDVDTSVGLVSSIVPTIFTWDSTVDGRFHNGTNGKVKLGSGSGDIYYGDETTETLSEGEHSLNHNYSDTTKTYTVTVYNITELTSNCFRDCTGLTSARIGDTVTSLGASSFLSCTGLKNVTIPSGVSVINNGCFFGCTGLEWVKFLSTTPPSLNVACFSSVPDSCVMYCPSGSLSDYQSVFNAQGYGFTVMEY